MMEFFGHVLEQKNGWDLDDHNDQKSITDKEFVAREGEKNEES